MAKIVFAPKSMKLLVVLVHLALTEFLQTVERNVPHTLIVPVHWHARTKDAVILAKQVVESMRNVTFSTILLLVIVPRISSAMHSLNAHATKRKLVFRQLNVVLIWHVWIKNVLIRVLEVVHRELTVVLNFTHRFAHARMDSLEIRSLNAYSIVSRCN